MRSEADTHCAVSVRVCVSTGATKRALFISCGDLERTLHTLSACAACDVQRVAGIAYAIALAPRTGVFRGVFQLRRERFRAEHTSRLASQFLVFTSFAITAIIIPDEILVRPCGALCARVNRV